jgi:hypothetical protein
MPVPKKMACVSVFEMFQLFKYFWDFVNVFLTLYQLFLKKHQSRLAFRERHRCDGVGEILR